MSAKARTKVAISLLWYVGRSAGDAFARLSGRRPRERLTVLYYHGISRDGRRGFARQMATLARRARVVPASYDGELPPGDHRVAITFDDAFRSVKEHALPELVERGFPATVFVPVGRLGQPPRWESGRNGRRLDEVMTADELRTLPPLIELGSHSVTHPHLPRLDEAHLREELESSRRRLADVAGAPVTLFAFPYGEHDARVVQACRDAGYERAFSIVAGDVDPRRADFVRGRIAVDPGDGRLEFFLKMCGAYGWLPHLSAIKRRLAR
jgi:peptidoglycan/xylan/chitin deacetylase (PgdA/CDA1 family)